MQACFLEALWRSFIKYTQSSLFLSYFVPQNILIPGVCICRKPLLVLSKLELERDPVTEGGLGGHVERPGIVTVSGWRRLEV